MKKGKKKGKKKDKLEFLAKEYGYSCPEEMFMDCISDAVAPGICMNEDCDYTTDVEPDQSRGWCEECEMNSVASCLTLMNLI